MAPQAARRNNIEEWWAAGFSAHSIIPPGAELGESLKESAKEVGKIPGYIRSDLTWVGWNAAGQKWTPALRQAMRDSCAAGAGVGVYGARHPGIDIDVYDAELSYELREHVLKRLGPALTRVGQSPKCLLMYRMASHMLDCPTRTWRFNMPGKQTAGLELIGNGRQYVVEGIHPKTKLPYSWDAHPLDHPELISEIDDFELLFTVMRELREMVVAAGGELASVSGAGNRGIGPAPDPRTLVGPEKVVLSALAAIPNDESVDRSQWITMGQALRAAAGSLWPGAALAAWTEWSLQWEPPQGSAPNTEEGCEAEWSRMRAPFYLGAEYVYAKAREHGWQGVEATRLAFANDPVPEEQDTEAQGAPVIHKPSRALSEAEILARSDVAAVDTVAQLFVEDHGERFLWVSDAKGWMEFTGTHWASIEPEQLEKLISPWLREYVAKWFPGNSRQDEQRRGALRNKRAIRHIAENAVMHVPHVPIGKLADNTAVLATPAGTIELVKGLPMRPGRREDYNLGVTAVAPARRGDNKPRRFLETLGYAAHGVRGAEAWVQVMLGQALLGNPWQKTLSFWGVGQNGKSTIVSVAAAVLGSYAGSTPTKMWQDEVAFSQVTLAGKRIVYAAELDGERGWNEELLKTVSGGDEIQVRGLFKSYGAWRPATMPLFAFNKPPRFTAITQAIARRLEVIAPAPEDAEASQIPPDKRETGFDHMLLREEGPQILRWMLDGAEMVLNGEVSPHDRPYDVMRGTQRLMAETDDYAAWLQTHLVKAKHEDIVPLDQAMDALRLFLKAQHADEPEKLSRLLAGVTGHRIAAKARELGMETTRGTGGVRIFRGRRIRGVLSTTELEAMAEAGSNIERIDLWREKEA